MKDMITELKQRYDFVFFDSPPILGVSDAAILASEVDMAIQVIQYRRYPQPMNFRAKQMIEKVGGNLVGIVLNNINMSQDESYYYYSGYYHDYYYSGNAKDTRSRSRRKNFRRPDQTGNQTKVLIAPPNSQGLAPMKLFVNCRIICWFVDLFASPVDGCVSLGCDPFFPKIPPAFVTMTGSPVQAHRRMPPAFTSVKQ